MRPWIVIVLVGASLIGVIGAIGVIGTAAHAAPPLPSKPRTIVVLARPPLGEELTERLAMIPELTVQDPAHVARPSDVSPRELARQAGAQLAVIDGEQGGLVLYDVSDDHATAIEARADATAGADRSADHRGERLAVAATLAIAETLGYRVSVLTRAQIGAPSMVATVSAARAALEQGKLDEAQRLYKLATRDAVPRRSTLLLGARLAERAGPAVAANAWDEALGRLPRDATALNDHGLQLRAAGRLQEAQAALAQAAESEPGWPQPRFNLALVLLDRGQPGEAIALLGPLVDAHPDEPAFVRQLALARRQSGNPAEAVPLLTALLRARGGDVELTAELTTALAEAGRLDEARRHAAALPAIEPRAIVARARVALAAEALDETVKLLDELDPAGLPRDLQRRRAHLLAVAHLHQRDPVAARTVLEPHVAADPFDAEGLYDLALAQTLMQVDTKGALQLVERARRLQPNVVPMLLLHARLLLEEGQPAAASQLLAHPRDTDWRITVLRAHAHFAEGQSVAACKLLGEAPPAVPTVASEWHYLRAETCLAAGERATSRRAAQSFLESAALSNPLRVRASQLAR